MSIQGKVKWFNPTKGYGFIAREDNEKDVFVHSSAVQAANLNLNEGDQLTFEITQGEKGNSAVNLQKKLEEKVKIKRGKQLCGNQI